MYIINVIIKIKEVYHITVIVSIITLLIIIVIIASYIMYLKFILEDKSSVGKRNDGREHSIQQ